MLIRSQNKRSREQFEEGQLKLEKDIWNTEKDRMIMQMENLKRKITDMKEMEESYLFDREKLHILFEKGIIDESGAPIPHINPTDMMM